MEKKRTNNGLMASLLLGAAFLMACPMLQGCSSDDEVDVPAAEEQKGEQEEDLPADVKPMVAPLAVDEATALFFENALCGPMGNDVSATPCFFSELIHKSQERYVMVNSEEELKALYECTAELPHIDFEHHTLVLARAYLGLGLQLESQQVEIEGDEAVLRLTFRELPGGWIICMVGYYSWGIYPKIEQKSITMVKSILPISELEE